jgi:hypothetical protein
MPLAGQDPVLARGFDILFDKELAPQTTPDSARVWAKAYADYALAGGVPAALSRISPLAAALTTAFNPELAGGGPPLFIQALAAFWLGQLVTSPPGTVSAVIPSGSVTSTQPDNATPLQQADGLAATIAAFTLGSVWVLPTAQPAPPILIT